MYVRIQCNVDLNITPDGSNQSHGMVLSYDPETEVLTLNGQYTGPQKDWPEVLSTIVTRAMYNLAQHKIEQGVA